MPLWAGQERAGEGDFAVHARHAALKLVGNLLQGHAEEKPVSHRLRGARPPLFEGVELLCEVEPQIDLVVGMSAQESRLAGNLFQGGLSQCATAEPVDQQPMHRLGGGAEKVSLRLESQLRRSAEDPGKRLMGQVGGR